MEIKLAGAMTRRIVGCPLKTLREPVSPRKSKYWGGKARENRDNLEERSREKKARRLVYPCSHRLWEHERRETFLVSAVEFIQDRFNRIARHYSIVWQMRRCPHRDKHWRKHNLGNNTSFRSGNWARSQRPSSRSARLRHP